MTALMPNVYDLLSTNYLDACYTHHTCPNTNTCMMLILLFSLLCVVTARAQLRDVENPTRCPTGIVWRRTDLLRHLSQLNATRSYAYYKRLRPEVPGPRENVRFLCRVFSSGRAHWSPFEETEEDRLETQVNTITNVTNNVTTPLSDGNAPSPVDSATGEYTYANCLLSHNPHDCLFGVVVRVRELINLAPKLPDVVSYIIAQQSCVYSISTGLTFCRESAVRALNAPYVCRT